MVHSKNVLSLLVLPTLALSSPSLHARHAHHHKPRAINWVYTTEVVATTTVIYGQEPTPESKAEVNEANPNVAVPQKPSSAQTTVVVSPSPVAAPPAPVAPVVPAEVNADQPEPEKQSKSEEKPSTSYSVYQPEKTETPSVPSGAAGGKLAIKNNCNYDVKMVIDRTQCGPIERDISIKAGETWSGDLTSCDTANPCYKIFKLDDYASQSNPLQLEAGYQPATKTLWYNWSVINCAKNGQGAGIENCPGGPFYMKCASTASNPGAAQTLECHDAQSCCTKTLGAYCDPFATAAKALGGLEPVAACLGQLEQVSLTAQIC